MKGKRRALLLVAAMAVSLAACGDSDGGGSGRGEAADGKGRFAGRTLVVRSSGGQLAEAESAAYYEPFERDTGAEVKIVETEVSTGAALLKSGVQASRPPWDVIVGYNEPFMRRFTDEGLLEKLDLDAIPNLKQLDSRYYFDHGLVNEVDAVVAAYSTADGVKPLPSAAAFFDPGTYPGTRAAAGAEPDAANGCLLALAADGVAPEDLVPIDIDRCLSVWDRVKPSVKVWWASGSEMAQIVVDNRVHYCLCFDGRVQQGRKINPEWNYSLEGALAATSWVGIVKGAKNRDMADALMQYFVDPRNEAEFVEHIGYSVPNPAAVDFLPDSLKAFLSTSDENRSKLLQLTPEQAVELAAQRDEVQRRWVEWLSQ